MLKANIANQFLNSFSLNLYARSNSFLYNTTRSSFYSIGVLNFHLFIYLWPHWVFVALHRLYIVAEHRILRLWLSDCNSKAQYLPLSGSRTQSQVVVLGLAAVWNVGSSWCRYRPLLPALQADSYPLHYRGSPYWSFFLMKRLYMRFKTKEILHCSWQ